MTAGTRGGFPPTHQRVGAHRTIGGFRGGAPGRRRGGRPDAERQRAVIARGLGRSYGDAAECSGGRVVDTAGLWGIGEIDEATGTVRVGEA